MMIETIGALDAMWQMTSAASIAVAAIGGLAVRRVIARHEARRRGQAQR